MQVSKSNILSKLKREHFNKMTRPELEHAILDAKQQRSFIELSESRAADEKREELDARITYLEKRLRR